MFLDRRSFILGGLGVLGAAVGGGAWFVNTPKFGRLPRGTRLERIKASPHFINGRFECLEPVEVLADPNENRIVTTVKFFLQDKSALFPKQPMLSTKTDLKSLPPNEDILVWMGHSTFFMQLGGKKILIDPVFSSYGSPVFFVNKAFPGSNIYTAEDVPVLDILAITHDHWDHLDYATVMDLKPKIKNVVVPLGVGEYFEQWDFDLNKLHEEDWDAVVDFGDLKIHFLPSQHFSGRFLTTNPTLWCAFAFETPARKVFLSGDGGYGKHFKAIGEKFGGFDLALMENGQYNLRWHAIHMLPEETVQATLDIRARQLITSHNGKFALGMHPWQEPYLEITRLSEGKSFERLTPMIGEKVLIGQSGQHFEHWWEKME